MLCYANTNILISNQLLIEVAKFSYDNEKEVYIDQNGDILLCTKQNTIVIVCQGRILHKTRSSLEI